MDIVITIIAGLLILTVLVVAHEFGHFSVGKACGIRIEEFSVGFGPKLLSKIRKKDQIRYSIRALPLGGYVQFYGEDEEVEGEPRAFRSRAALAAVSDAAGRADDECGCRHCGHGACFS